MASVAVDIVVHVHFRVAVILPSNISMEQESSKIVPHPKLHPLQYDFSV